MYVAVKGGERAIENAHRLLAHERRGARDVPEVTLPQIVEQLALAVDRVMSEGSVPEEPAISEVSPSPTPRVTDILGRDGLIEASPAAEADVPVGDLTREPLNFLADRDLRLQNLARADEGFLLALGYSTQRG